VVGLGRAGWNMHVQAMRDLPDRYQVVAVTDPDAGRREQAVSELGCRAYEQFADAIKDEQVELVAIASPSALHYQQVTDALRAGKDVLCDKPLAMRAVEVDEMMQLARENERGLYVFQSRRYEPVFQKIKQLLDARTFGEVALIRHAWHKFSRRWDWQAMRQVGGGDLGNACAHALDQLLTLAGPGEPELLGVDLRNGLSSGDAEDTVKIVFRCGDGPVIDLEIMPMDAFGCDLWRIYGTEGTLRATRRQIWWKVADWSQMPPRPLERDGATGRQYPHEDVVFNEYHWQTDQTRQLIHAFYRDLYKTIVHGAPPVITVQSVRRQIALVEHCREHHPVRQMQSIASQWRPRSAQNPKE
jgi:predicted dehydrogenase